jgi:catechol 2,3-dioxygenase-like lactoylglutathione lyase family enzyme
MATLRINHVTVHADDLEASARFYEEVFGAERIPSPNFGEPVVFLQLGEHQLHLVEKQTDAPTYHHFAVDVDDFERVYLEARKRDILDDPFGAKIREHPAGWVQMWLRDPAGNLVEVDWPDATTLDRSTLVDLVRFEDTLPQAGEERTATLYTGPARG